MAELFGSALFSDALLLDSRDGSISSDMKKFSSKRTSYGEILSLKRDDNITSLVTFFVKMTILHVYLLDECA